jgi:uncharacterized protein YunC (DUF1805 family)
MSGRNGLIIGALIGIGIGLIAVMATMHLLSNEMVDKQAEAHERGLQEGMKSVAADGIDISDHLNKGMIEENERLANQVRGVKTQLQALQGRDDLTPQAKDQIAGIIDGLE